MSRASPLPIILPRTAHEPTLVVAELSANHGGSLARAVESIRAAASAGADAIKLQTYTADSLTIDCDRSEFRIADGPWSGRTLHGLYREAATPWEWHPQLDAAAREVGLPLFSTPFDAAAVAYLEQHDVPAHKVASFELGDHELLALVAATRKPLIVSTGMATLDEIAAAVAIVRGVWAGADPGLALLRCVSAYPAPAEDMNLATIADLGARFGVIPGLSDHTLGSAVAVASVALGARVIEKHFTLRRGDGGPDAHFSCEPAEFRRLVDDVRTVERAVGKVRYGPTPAEQASLAFRRSIFVVRDIAAGEPITRDNARVIRPGHGLAPKHLPEVLGRVAARACARGTPLSWDLLA